MYNDELADILDQIYDRGVLANGPTTAGVSLQLTPFLRQLVAITSDVVYPYPARQALLWRGLLFSFINLKVEEYARMVTRGE